MKMHENPSGNTNDTKPIGMMVFAQYFTNAMTTNEYVSATQKPSQSQSLILCARKTKTIGMMISKSSV